MREVALGTLTDKNVKLVKLLNGVAFPVSYNEHVYEEILQSLGIEQSGFRGQGDLSPTKKEKDPCTKKLCCASCAPFPRVS